MNEYIHTSPLPRLNIAESMALDLHRSSASCSPSQERGAREKPDQGPKHRKDRRTYTHRTIRQSDHDDTTTLLRKARFAAANRRKRSLPAPPLPQQSRAHHGNLQTDDHGMVRKTTSMGDSHSHRTSCALEKRESVGTQLSRACAEREQSDEGGSSEVRAGLGGLCFCLCPHSLMQRK